MPGAAQCIANLGLEKKKIERMGRQALLNWCNEVLRESQIKYVPVDTGTLRRSGRVAIMTEYPLQIKIGFTAEHALQVHEVPARHDHGSMKFLATPFNLMSYRLMKKLEAEVEV